VPPVKTGEPRAAPEHRLVKSPVGGRIRTARSRAGLTQQQLAGDRYTKAYISALENGLVRPSVAALEYLAPRLGTTPGALLADSQPAWSRVDADLQLASGSFQLAADAYTELLPSAAGDKGTRAEILTGLAEAEVRQTHASEAIAAASEAVELFEAAGRPIDAAFASYWLSAGLHEQGNGAESKAILQSLLAKVRLGLQVTPDFKLRLIMALSSTEAHDGNHDMALSYLEEVRALEDTLDDRRRATFLSDLAISYVETGDYEAAIRTGYQALGLFRSYDTAVEIASLENEMALANLGVGNVARAEELANSALSRWTKLGNDRRRAHVLDTQAQVALAREKWGEAVSLATQSLDLATSVENVSAVSDATLTIARAKAGIAINGKDAKSRRDAMEAFERAAAEARSSGRAVAIKRTLTEYADFLAANGEHKAAFELSREALTSTR
jgi:transcriptional regulator with XRE-family HTH domain